MPVLFSLLSACGHRDLCESLTPGTPADGLPKVAAGLGSQSAVFDMNFSPMFESGAPQYRCCFAQRQGAQFAGCAAQLDCTGFDAEVYSLGEPYAGDEYLGAYFCQVAVRDGEVVSSWGQYND